MNKSLLKGLNQMNLELVAVERTANLYNSHIGDVGVVNVTKDSRFAKAYGVDDMTGHLFQVKAKKLGTAGSLETFVYGTVYLQDHMTNKPHISFEIDKFERGNKFFMPKEYTSYNAYIQ